MKHPVDEPITIGGGGTIEVSDSHGPDWFPMYVQSGLHQTTVYLRRAQLEALSARLNEILDD
jgi:hypothetical protein